jgi:diguanylate cyclase (GGDEF)-like protein
MAYGLSKMRLNGQMAASNGESIAAGGRPLRGFGRRDADPEIELQILRTANTRLLREVAALKEREAQKLELADRDGLTGLFNRRRMMELLGAAIADAERQGHCVGLLFIDLNGFKGINDEYGHAAGDTILTTVANRVAARVRTGDFVCRYGGDEFVVVLPNVPDEPAVARVAGAIRERVALPYPVHGNSQHLTAAIGVSMYPRDGRSAGELLHRADLAMYRLKARLGRPMVSLGTAPQRQPSRRRNDNYGAA